MSYTAPGITFLSLMRKYRGNITRAHELEIRAAIKMIPEGKDRHTALEEAVHNYKIECMRKIRRPCINRHGICEDEKCCCW